jgi:hypothetical protein
MHVCMYACACVCVCVFVFVSGRCRLCSSLNEDFMCMHVCMCAEWEGFSIRAL